VTEDRLRAAWDEALTAGGLAATIADGLDDPAERALARVLSRARRGLYRLSAERGCKIAQDVWSGASFLILPKDDVGRAIQPSEAAEEAPLFDARIVAASDGCAMLPGVIFHPADAAPHIYRIVDAARQRDLSPDRVCDALLRMEHAFRTLTRVKIAYAYRVEAVETKARP